MHMKINQMKELIDSLFSTTENSSYDNESGITVYTDRDINRIGYCVNLTLETVDLAIKNKVDMMVTHHDAWDFVFGMKEACVKKLEENGIGHYFVHLPLDDAEFGTNETIANGLRPDFIERSHPYEGFDCGRICTFNEPVPFKTLIERMEGMMKELARSWAYSDKPITKVGIVCGGGEGTTLAKAAFDEGCDVYITGEKVLYTIQYARFAKKNLIIGSHTFIELPGVQHLAMKLKETVEIGGGNLSVVELEETHIEIM